MQIGKVVRCLWDFSLGIKCWWNEVIGVVLATGVCFQTVWALYYLVLSGLVLLQPTLTTHWVFHQLGLKSNCMTDYWTDCGEFNDSLACVGRQWRMLSCASLEKTFGLVLLYVLEAVVPVSC